MTHQLHPSLLPKEYAPEEKAMIEDIALCDLPSVLEAQRKHRIYIITNQLHETLGIPHDHEYGR